MRHFIIAVLLVLLAINGAVSAAEDDVFVIETEGSYRVEAGAPAGLMETMALFIAKRKAVDLAGRYLARNLLIEIYEMKRDEIYSLAAREIRAEILEEKRQTAGTALTYRVRIKARVQASDFIKAEIEDARQEKKERKASYQEEMEQPIPAAIDPGRDISKAYRLLREKKWRIAEIYLNHLEKKYPTWDSVYMAKAIAHYVLHEPVFMKKALQAACRLDNQTACEDLRDLKSVHEHDFSLSIEE